MWSRIDRKCLNFLIFILFGVVLSESGSAQVPQITSLSATSGLTGTSRFNAICLRTVGSALDLLVRFS